MLECNVAEIEITRSCMKPQSSQAYFQLFGKAVQMIFEILNDIFANIFVVLINQATLG